MADCEVCGTTGVGTRQVRTHGALLDACRACQDRLGISDEEINQANQIRQRISGSSGGQNTHSSRGRGAARDIMAGGDSELASDFAARIRRGREERGWDQRTLALRMKERINEVKRAESGQQPSDKVLAKFEKTLDIELHESTEGGHERNVPSSSPRALNLGDLLDAAKRDQD